VVSNSSLLCGSDFAGVSGIEVIGLASVIVTIDWYEPRSRGRRSESKNRLESETVVSSSTRLSCTNFACVSGIEVIFRSRVPVSVNWSETRRLSCAQVESVTFRSISVVSGSTSLSCTDFASVSGIEVIVRGTVEVTENRGDRKRSETQNTFRGISVVSNGALLSCTNFGSVSGIEVIALSCVKVTINRNRRAGSVRIEVTQDAFASVSVISSGALLRGADFAGIVSVKVILGSSVEITINRNHSRMRVRGNMPVIHFALVSMVSSGAVLSCTDFGGVRGIEMVTASSVKVTVNWNNIPSFTSTKTKNQVQS